MPDEMDTRYDRIAVTVVVVAMGILAAILALSLF